jgi:hypothetical protein
MIVNRVLLLNVVVEKVLDVIRRPEHDRGESHRSTGMVTESWAGSGISGVPPSHDRGEMYP